MGDFQYNESQVRLEWENGDRSNEGLKFENGSLSGGSSFLLVIVGSIVALNFERI